MAWAAWWACSSLTERPRGALLTWGLVPSLRLRSVTEHWYQGGEEIGKFRQAYRVPHSLSLQLHLGGPAGAHPSLSLSAPHTGRLEPWLMGVLCFRSFIVNWYNKHRADPYWAPPTHWPLCSRHPVSTFVLTDQRRSQTFLVASWPEITCLCFKSAMEESRCWSLN